MAVRWLSDSHGRSVPIDRKNSFHLLLSDDELKLLKLLAEREGLNASDHLRSLLRQMAGASPHSAQVIRLGAGRSQQAFEGHPLTSKAVASRSRSSKPRSSKPKAKGPKTKRS